MPRPRVHRDRGRWCGGLLDLTCTAPSSETIRWNQPLTNQTRPTDFTISSRYSLCLSTRVLAMPSGGRQPRDHGVLSSLSHGDENGCLVNRGQDFV